MALRRMCAVVLIGLVVLVVIGSIVTRAQAADDLAALHAQVSQLYGQGKYAAAVPIAERYVALARKKHGEQHTEFATAISWLALVYDALGRYAEAEPLHKRSLAIREKALGAEHPDVGISLNNLAELYQDQGRYAEAEPLLKRALAIREKALGSEHADVAASLNNLAALYEDQGRYAEAEPLYKRSLAIYEKVYGLDHTLVAIALNNLAQLYWAQRRNAEAEPLYKRALAVKEKALGLDHPSVATALNNLANLYNVQGRYAEAEPLYKRSLAIREKVLGPDHPSVAESLNNLATLVHLHRDWAQAAAYWQHATKVLERRAERGLAGSEGSSVKGEAVRNSQYFSGLVKMTDLLAPEGHADRATHGREMFETAQWAQGSEAASSLAQMAARSAKGDTVLAGLVRERQDLVGEWQAKDKQLIAAKSEAPIKRNTKAEKLLSDRLVAIDARLAAIDAQFAKDFPDYASLSSPRPAAVAEVQAQLHDGEALVLFLDTPKFTQAPEETFIWVITEGGMRWEKSEFGTKALTARVAALRCGLDATLWDDVEGARKCKDALGAVPRIEMVEFNGREEKTQVLPFDVTRAHELYKALLGPVESMIKGKRLLIVPSGPLTSLPFNVLVMEAPKTAIPETLAQYRDVTWLGSRTALTVLPSVSSLKALRQFAKTSRATKPYLGIGNPLLDGPQDDPVFGAVYKKLAELARTKRCSQGIDQVALARAPRSVRSIASLFRGAQVDIEQIRYQVALPEAADELCAVARRLGVPDSEILLGANATEARLKDLSDQGRLADYAIVHFATHGALSGQVQGSAEPGLILTPPPKGTSDPKALERDDGFLTASEIAALKLDADWVILSACNTAGAQGEGTEALSGMARAFFYAGARTLLVSHWAVGTNAAVKLTTRTFDELKAHPEIGRAEAFRRSMMELIEKGSLAEAHPSQWAPFVVVGEGAASR
jgi:CHAT domain-containing protein/tetratricopeptide (TPR) repeat protein